MNLTIAVAGKHLFNKFLHAVFSEDIGKLPQKVSETRSTNNDGARHYPGKRNRTPGTLSFALNVQTEPRSHLLRCQETAAMVASADGKERLQKASSMQARTTARSDSELSEFGPICISEND